MSILLAQEEAFWKQRAKVFWLRDGDTNSKFFHAMASAQEKHNEITKLEREDGGLVKDHAGLCAIAKNYFEQLFQRNQGQYDPILQFMETRVSHDDNTELLKPFRLDEFRKALF